ncbi:GNAT family N-acetyltransferase [Monashia sp. NPDC004114]
MSLHVDEIDLAPGDPVSEAWVAVHNTASRHSWGDDAQQIGIEEILDIAPRRAEARRSFGIWLGDGDDRMPVAAAQTVRHTRENTETGGIWLSVDPAHRRRGLGSMLLAHCEQVLRDEGCTRVHDHTESPVESGDAATDFALARGYRTTQVDLRQKLVLPLDDERLATFAPGLDPAAYVIETAVDGLPEEWLEDRALLSRRMSTDAPTGDIDLAEEDWDADRVRRLWNTPSPIWAVESVARHVPSGHLVGFTDLVVRPSMPDVAIQTDTLVLREHRGHALGLAMKVANLRALQSEKPAVRGVHTWNADTNAHMIAINRQLGFRVAGWSREWAKDL